MTRYTERALGAGLVLFCILSPITLKASLSDFVGRAENRSENTQFTGEIIGAGEIRLDLYRFLRTMYCRLPGRFLLLSETPRSGSRHPGC